MQEGTCAIDGCTKPVGKVKSRGWCTAHYTRWQRHRDPLGGRARYGSSGCEIPGCAAKHHANGLCVKHANAQRYEIPQQCAVDGCERPQRCRGWCSAHYQRWRTHGHPLRGGPVRRDRGKGFPSNWYSEQRRRKIGWPSGETLAYIEILRRDPCSYCGAPWEHTDHIRPVANGGAGDWTNLTSACARCNHAKHTHDLLTFMEMRRDSA
jgi:5-methylcytosine-specific restriction endonuclease McrA